MRRPRILLTNDDSHDSPLFHYGIDALRQLGELEIAVPATEQSWKGKSMTRYGAVYAERTVIHGASAWSVTGTPADCVNLALNHLLEQRPDIVVSGINIGRNVGVGFVFSSGTVGACLEANIAGLPGLALSQDLSREDYVHWDRNRAFKPEVAAALQRATAALVPRIWHRYVENHLGGSTTWNVNFPNVQHAEPELRRARLGYSRYGNCFHPRGDQYHFGLVETDLDAAADTDYSTIRAGHVSVTLLDMRDFGQALA